MYPQVTQFETHNLLAQAHAERRRIRKEALRRAKATPRWRRVFAGDPAPQPLSMPAD